jgi:hypothetical protein
MDDWPSRDQILLRRLMRALSYMDSGRRRQTLLRLCRQAQEIASMHDGQECLLSPILPVYSLDDIRSGRVDLRG